MIIGIGFLVAIIMGLLGRYVAKEKNRSKAEGFWLGFLFSILGVIIVALLPTKKNEKKKPKEVIISKEERKRIDEEIKNIKRNEDKVFGRMILWFFGICTIAVIFIYLIDKYL